MPRLRTGISQAFWCDPTHGYDFRKAARCRVMRGNRPAPTCWLDELFEGGLVIPDTEANEPRAITMILSGRPGTGKTTLAMELCCRCAEAPDEREQNEDELARPLRSWYVTSEARMSLDGEERQFVRVAGG